MKWQYRVFKAVHTMGDTPWTIYNIREMHSYVPEATMNTEAISWSQLGISPRGDTFEELKADLARMTAALDLPVLDEDDYPEVPTIDKEIVE